MTKPSLSELWLAVFIWPIFILRWPFKYCLCSLTVDSSTRQPQTPKGWAAFKNRNILSICSYRLMYCHYLSSHTMHTLVGHRVLWGHFETIRMNNLHPTCTSRMKKMLQVEYNSIFSDPYWESHIQALHSPACRQYLTGQHYHYLQYGIQIVLDLTIWEPDMPKHLLIQK